MAAKGIVFASYNYRLSLWGWPHATEIAQANETQNFGLLDTRAAVEWIKANAKTFGGDSKKIVLGGERYVVMLCTELGSRRNDGRWQGRVLELVSFHTAIFKDEDGTDGSIFWLLAAPYRNDQHVPICLAGRASN